MVGEGRAGEKGEVEQFNSFKGYAHIKKYLLYMGQTDRHT